MSNTWGWEMDCNWAIVVGIYESWCQIFWQGSAEAERLNVCGGVSGMKVRCSSQIYF